MDFPFSIDDVNRARQALGRRVITTPLYDWHSYTLDKEMGADTDVILKLELFQFTNSFKPRGALTVMLNASADILAKGVLAVSGGNHGIAVAYAARCLGCRATIYIPRSASILRIERCRELGADVILVDDFATGFAIAGPIAEAEGRLLVHPYEGYYTALGTATLALEWVQQVAALGQTMDAVIVPVGGGGLIGGMAALLKQMQPTIKIYGIEPEGADSIYRSLQSGHLEKLTKRNTIADSLATPEAREFSFGLVKRYVDDVFLISDDAMRGAMKLLYDDMKLVAEPACAAATAGLLGPLRDTLRGRRVGVLACGSNIDIHSFAKEIMRAELERR